MNTPATPLVNPEVLDRIRDWRGYAEAKLGFRNHWYPTLNSSEVAEGKPVPFELAGEKLLINRIDGKVYCIKDQCLHRGVPLSRKLECYSKDTITCWYHGWTYQWADGKLCDILTDPSSKVIGTRALQTYPAQEVQGLVFVFLGDTEPTPIGSDLPPGFDEPNRRVQPLRRLVNANWRIGAENGFDTTHIFIHKDSRLIRGNQTMLPLGFAPKPDNTEPLFEVRHTEGGNIGIFDLLAERGVPHFEGSVHGEVVRRAIHGGDKRIANEISLWMPGVLKVDPFPDPELIHFEWYVPRDADSHWYIHCSTKLVEGPDGDAEFAAEYEALWKDIYAHGFNDDDIWAREATQPFYQDDWGWLEEQLFEADACIMAWRKLASEHNHGIQHARRRG
ncbi:MAG: Rieske 2Fe-2S domain-containing protein [Immundisolibacter sp.]|uniref:Rieske 2Fe-2S domain-containing protein n=1 Tax=Immundisolibacter sp. TaxID=1934948 RepID=UPI003EDFC237